VTTYKGIAAVTQTLWYLLSARVLEAVPEARVTLSRPEQPPAASVNEPRLNIYLVQVLPDPMFRANDLPTRNDRGTTLHTPTAAVNLRYLLSFFGGSENAQLMLGAAEVALRERAVLDADLIRQALANHHKLLDSGLEAQTPPVRVVPSAVSLEDLARFWSGFLQMPYTVSTLYEAMTVILTSPLTAAAPALPVQRTHTSAGGVPPQLDPLPTVAFDPGGTRVPVSGRGLAAGQHVRVGDGWVAIGDDGGLAFTVPAGDLRPGPQPVTLGSAAAQPLSIPGSHPQTLRVRPAITRAQANDRRVTVAVAPPVRPGQHTTLSLVGATRSIQLAATPTATSSELTFTAPADLPDGRYVALLDVDGVSSLPDTATHTPAVELSP
jgi:hypothetical protein